MAGSGVWRRRDLLKGMGGAGAAAGLVAASAITPLSSEVTEGAAPGGVHAHSLAAAVSSGAEPTEFFTSTEASTIEALVDTLIPDDEIGPGAVKAGVPSFIDRQMAGAFGRGARMYLQGPFGDGTPEQGYQLPLPPAELYRIGLADLNTWCIVTYGGKAFDQLSSAERTAALKAVETGQAQFAQVPARVFFDMLLQNTMEGYFGDPLYGGNRDKAVWKMIGFPGATGDYMELVEPYRNKKYEAEPKSVKDLG